MMQTAVCLSLQVAAWLQKVFAGSELAVPSYEVSERTLDLLQQLKQANERQETYSQLIKQDLQLKTDEYSAEGILQLSAFIVTAPGYGITLKYDSV